MLPPSVEGKKEKEKEKSDPMSLLLPLAFLVYLYLTSNCDDLWDSKVLYDIMLCNIK